MGGVQSYQWERSPHHRAPWLKRFAWPVTKHQNYQWLGGAAFHQARLLGERFRHWHESYYGRHEKLRRSGGFPTHMELRETINADSHKEAPKFQASATVNIYVDHLAVPPSPRTRVRTTPPLLFRDYPTSRIPAVKMHPSGNPELTGGIHLFRSGYRLGAYSDALLST